MARQSRRTQTSPPRPDRQSPSNHPIEEQVPFSEDLTLPSDIRAAVEFQRKILDQLKSHAFGQRDLYAIRLALEEGLINAVQHGNQLDPMKSVRVSYCIHEDCFYIRICDEGPGFNPGAIPDPRLKENLERPSGRGLMLIRHFMSEVHYLDGGNKLLMWKRRTGK